MPEIRPDPRLRQAWERLDRAGRLAKLRHHLAAGGNVPVPVRWVAWLLAEHDRHAAAVRNNGEPGDGPGGAR